MLKTLAHVEHLPTAFEPRMEDLKLATAWLNQQFADDPRLTDDERENPGSMNILSKILDSPNTPIKADSDEIERFSMAVERCTASVLNGTREEDLAEICREGLAAIEELAVHHEPVLLVLID